MAKFDSQYPEQVSPEMGDKILIAAAQDGNIMALPFSVVMAYIQKYLNEIDDELSITSLHPVQNKVITKAINDILAQLQPVDDKEIIAVKTASANLPVGGEDGDLWIDLGYAGNQCLRECDGAGSWDVVDAKKNVIYITADTSHIYVWNGTEFIDTTGEPIDNTIYINNLNALESYTDEGIYRVCLLTEQFFILREYKWYTFIVERSELSSLHLIYYTQTLSNRSGYQSRKKTNNGQWSEWEEFIFASQEDLQEVFDIACAGL